MSLLHNLPLDVIRKHIFPKLDWSSRVTANALLEPGDRLSFPLKKDAGISLMIRKEHDIIKKYLHAVHPDNGQKENYQHIMDLMSIMKNKRYLLQYSTIFRNMFIHKCQGFADLDSSEYATATISEEDKLRLSAVCQALLRHVESIPFERDVISSCQEKWTAVTAGPPHIVQQTALYEY